MRMQSNGFRLCSTTSQAQCGASHELTLRMPRPEEHREITLLGSTSADEGSLQTPRFRWRVRDCLFCSWRRLPDAYSVAEMWQMLRQGRFAKAVRLRAHGK
jgi:hypothetical protein